LSAVSDEVATGAIIRGMSRQVGNEIDEFVVEALRNNLLGLPLDLPAINIARGRETGIPSLNDARSQLFTVTADVQVKPYTSWLDFAQNIIPGVDHQFHRRLRQAYALMRRRRHARARAIATRLVLAATSSTRHHADCGVDFADRLAFLSSPNGRRKTPVSTSRPWVGGLAEEIVIRGAPGLPFHIFEYQMEHLNGDRFYYLSRTQGMNCSPARALTFTDLIMRNTDLGDLHHPRKPSSGSARRSSS
jgi:hypothetical protein